MPPTKFQLNPIYYSGQMSLGDFQDSRHCSHHGYRYWKILSILHLHVSQMPPTKFQLNPIIWEIWWPSWILERNNFPYSESLFHSDAFHQVLAQSNLQFGRCGFKNLKMATMAILDIWMEWFLAILSPCLPNASHQVSASSDLLFRSRCCLKIFNMAAMVAILDIGTERF